MAAVEVQESSHGDVMDQAIERIFETDDGHDKCDIDRFMDEWVEEIMADDLERNEMDMEPWGNND